MNVNYANKHIAILGYGIEGKSAATYFKARGANVTICEKDSGVQQTDEFEWQTGDSYLEHLDEFDLVVRSPGVRPDLFTTTTPVTTGTIMALEKYREQVVGVTGTKGKGTTATLIAKLLEAAGKTVHLGGNIGRPVFEFIDDIHADDVVVLELSSFQLIDIPTSPHLAVVVMMETDHLDWHIGMDEYIEAKHQIVAHQVLDDTVVYWGDNELVDAVIKDAKSQKLAITERLAADSSHLLLGEQPLLALDKLGLPGAHNVRNAAIALNTANQFVELTDEVQATWESVLSSFTGLKYRLQKTREKGAVSYINDSVSTTPGTAAAAIEAYEDPRVVILGGRPKGGSFKGLAEVAAKSTNLKGLVLIGEASDAIAQALSEAGYEGQKSQRSDTLEHAVKTAEALLGPRGLIILSPGCASFDMFQNIYDRGEQFDQIVLNR